MSVRVRASVWASAGLAACLTLFLSSNASAMSTYVDVQPVFEYMSGGDVVQGTFDIMDPGNDCVFVLCDRGGFDPSGSERITSAWIGFLFYSTDYATEEAWILLGPDPSDPLQTDGFDQQIYVLHLESMNANVEVVAALNATGQLDWTVYAPNGNLAPTSGYHYDCCQDDENDFILKYAKLKAHGEPIPEPTAALLYAAGFGVIGMVVRRRPRA